MRQAIRLGLASLRRGPAIALILWSIPEALPTALSGYAMARAVDKGFLAGRPVVGLAWLGTFLLAAVASAIGSRQVYRRLGDLVEPFRDDLVRRVVSGALRHGVAGRTDDGAVARLTRQIEVVRDSYAGLILVLRGFTVTVVGVVAGLLSVAPEVTALILVPFGLGIAAFAATLGLSADRQLAAIRADEQLATTAGLVLAGTRDVVARGAEDHAAELAAGPIEAQANAERALAKVEVLRTLCFAVGGWLPLLLVLVAGPALAARGLTAGALLGGLTYVLFGLQPALRTLTSGLGSAGLRYLVTVRRILQASETGAQERQPVVTALPGYDLRLRGVTFAYGPHSEPVLHGLDLLVPEGEHLAIVGPSGIGKSTLANLLCGLLEPDAGAIQLGGIPVTDLSTAQLAKTRVLIPQEAYVFTGTVSDNVTYLRPAATTGEVERAVDAVGANALLDRLGGMSAQLTPAALSAGERQLIALVRAYVAAAPLVVLDEATCHLDPRAEQQAELAFAARGGTLIVIAHRISSALRARRVLVLDGTTAIAGDHDTLVSESALYRDLLGHWTVRSDHQPGRRGRPGGPPACGRPAESGQPAGIAHRFADPR
ncbi:ABC transporter ATP-binding protein [Flindersiella endophytica]